VTGGIYTLQLKNNLYSDRLCVVSGKAPKGRLTVLCRNMTEGTKQKIIELSICVHPKNLFQPGIIRVEDDWYGYAFTEKYPVMYQIAFLQTPRILKALVEMGLAANTIQLVRVIPNVEVEQIQCHRNVEDACRSQRNCSPVFGYSLLLGLSCGSINIEAHYSIVQRKSGFFVDVTPDQDSSSSCKILCVRPSYIF